MERYNPDQILLATIDMQRGFMPDEKDGSPIGIEGYGELPVEGAHEIVENVNAVSTWAEENGIERVTTQDWHPAETAHFGDGDMQWPVHCVGGTPGAELADAFDSRDAETFRKGMESIDSADQDTSYSGFNAVNEAGEMLGDRIRKSDVMAVVIVGLALGGKDFDTCVDSTAKDIAQKTEADVYVVTDAAAAINRAEIEAIYAKMEAAGVNLVTTEQITNGELLAA